MVVFGRKKPKETHVETGLGRKAYLLSSGAGHPVPCADVVSVLRVLLDPFSMVPFRGWESLKHPKTHSDLVVIMKYNDN